MFYIENSKNNQETNQYKTGEGYSSYDRAKNKKKTNILSLPSHERPREKLIKSGSAHLTDIELISIILGSGIRDKNVLQLASQVLQVLQSDSTKGESLYKKLISIKGIGDSKACTLSAIFEIVKRSASAKVAKIGTPKEIYHLLNDYAHKRREHFVVVYLNKTREVISKSVLAIGSDNRACIGIKDIFQEALLQRATMVVLAHNHPSGNIKPSSQDIKITQRIVRAGELLDIQVMDHIILTKSEYFSFYQNKLM